MTVVVIFLIQINQRKKRDPLFKAYCRRESEFLIFRKQPKAGVVDEESKAGVVGEESIAVVVDEDSKGGLEKHEQSGH